VATHFFAPLRRASSSRSRCASSRARCCARFSAAVMRGTMSSKGLSTIRMDLILGGLPRVSGNVPQDDGCSCTILDARSRRFLDTLG
jgi:hypothetical protein